MQFKLYKIHFLFIVSVFVMSSLLAKKPNKSVLIKKISTERIQNHARHLKSVMNRRNILMKAGIVGMSGYALYTLASWFKLTQNNNSQDATENNETVSRQEFDRLRNQVRQLHDVNNLDKTNWQKTWSSLKTTGKSIFQWIGMPILLTSISNRFHRFMGFTDSIELFDQQVTHCMELLQYLVYNIQKVAEFINRTEQHVDIDKKDFAITCNRLVTAVEKMIGFIQAKRNSFAPGLKKEAGVLEQRLTEYAQELAEDLHGQLKTANTDLRQVAQIIAHFGQRYTQEKQRFALIEQEA